MRGVGIISDLYTVVKKAWKAFEAPTKWKFADHSARALERFGSSLVRSGFLFVAVKGCVSAGSRIAAVASVAIPVLVGVGVALSSLALFIDARNIYKIYTFQKKFDQVRDIKLKHVANTALIQLVKETSPGVIRKTFGVEQKALTNLLEKRKRSHQTHTQVDQLFHHLGKRISAQIGIQILNVAMDIALMLSNVLLIIPVTQPGGYVFFALSLGGAFYTMKYEAKDAYDFQHRIGLINSPYGPTKSFKEFLFDKYGVTAILEALDSAKEVEEAPPKFASPLQISVRRFSTLDLQSLNVRYA